MLSAHLVRATAGLVPLPRWLEAHPLTAMSPSARQLAWRVGRHITRNPDHGFVMAERVPPSGVGSLWELYQAAPSVEHIHRAYPRFNALLLDSMVVELVEREASVCLRHVSPPGFRIDRAEEDFRAAMQVATWRALHACPSLGARTMHFTYQRPRSTAAHERLLGTQDLRFAQPCFALELDLRWWKAPLPTSDRALFGQRLEAACRAAQACVEVALEQRVEALITESLHRDPRAERVAEQLGMSVRTLHRQLAARGYTFRDLAESARLREAALVEQTEEIHGARALSSTQRARMLGFSGGGALRNALRRWRKR